MSQIDTAKNLIATVNAACGEAQKAFAALELTYPFGDDIRVSDDGWRKLVTLDDTLLSALRKAESGIRSALRKVDTTVEKQVDLTAKALAAGTPSGTLEVAEVVSQARVTWNKDAVEGLLLLLAPPGKVLHYDAIVAECQSNGILPTTQTQTTLHVDAQRPTECYKGKAKKDNA